MVDRKAEYKNFDVERQQIAEDLAQLRDKSPKGSIDEPIRRFLNLINSQPDWITTSTCSGRLVSYLPGKTSQVSQYPADQFHQPSSRVPQAVNGKGGGSWLFVSHSTLESAQLANPLHSLFGNDYHVDSTPDPKNWACDGSSLAVHLVYQPPVLHLLARSVAVAVPILTSVIGAGFRNSGITVGHRGRVILAIRASSGGLDVPIAIEKSPQVPNGLGQVTGGKGALQLLVSVEYLSKLLLQGNQLMQQNEAKLQRLFEALSDSFHQSAVKINHQWESNEDRRQRMRSEGLAARAASNAPHSALDERVSSSDEDLSHLSLLG